MMDLNPFTLGIILFYLSYSLCSSINSTFLYSIIISMGYFILRKFKFEINTLFTFSGFLNANSYSLIYGNRLSDDSLLTKALEFNICQILNN